MTSGVNGRVSGSQRGSRSRHHKFLCEEPEYRSDESGYPYKIEDGVNVELGNTLKPYSREYNSLTLIDPYPSKAQQEAEEAAWAARSGPVTIRKKEQVA